MATETGSDNRRRLVRAASDLVYKKGFRQTTLADIASEAQIPLGNLYYYFRTKEDIGIAIIDSLLADARNLESQLDSEQTPTQRLIAFVDVTVTNRFELAEAGCPMGSLCTELNKQGGASAQHSALLFKELLGWLEQTFVQVNPDLDGHLLAVHLLSALQGIAVLAHSLHAPELVEREAGLLKQWIRGLADEK